jgi:ribonuclease HI
MHNGQGQRQQVIEASIGAGSLIAKGMALKGCKVSGPKSLILATDPELASLVQAGISKEGGILLPIIQTARDLGIDRGFSKRRRILTAGSMVKKSSAKLKKLLQLSKITTKARRLFRTGVVPQIAWGQEAKGLAPTVVSDQLWAKAASSYLGKGAEQGIDWHLTFPTLKKLRGKKGNPKAAGALEAAMQGAWWFGSRLLDLGLDQANQWCQWCHDNKGLQEADTPAHGIWTCPRWRGCEAGPATKDSQDIVEQAEEGAQHNPIFWFRGLVPKGWAKEILEGWEPTFETQAGGCLEEVSSSEPYAMKEGDIMATDGSGGCYPTNTTLRRVGWGLSLARREGEPIGWARGGIAGEQTVPRAELAAVPAGVQQTSGPLTTWSDSAYVVLGASKGWGIKMTNNQDLWGAVRERLASRPGIVQVIKVKGHATPLDVKQGLSTARQVFMNDCADTQAGLGASRAQLPPNVAKSIEELIHGHGHQGSQEAG